MESEEVQYDIVKEFPSTKHRYKVGQPVYILHGARATKETITGIKITVDRVGKTEIVYLFQEIFSPHGTVGRKEEDVWEHKKDLIESIFEL